MNIDYKEPIKLDYPIGTKFKSSGDCIYTIDSITLDNEIKISWEGAEYILDGKTLSKHFKDYDIGMLNDFFKNGVWKVYEEPIKLDVAIGTKFTKEKDRVILTIDSIDKNNNVNVTWFSVNSASNYTHIYSIEKVNRLFKTGVWKVYNESIKLDVAIGTRFKSISDYIYTVDSINLNGKVLITWKGDAFSHSIESANLNFRDGSWKVYTEPIKLDVPIGTKFKKSCNYTYTIDSINSDNVVKVIWEGLKSASKNYNIISVNEFFKNGVWKVYNEPIHLFKTEDGIHKYLGDSYIKLVRKGFNIIRVDGCSEQIIHREYIYFDDIDNLYEYVKLNELRYSLNDIYKMIEGIK